MVEIDHLLFTHPVILLLLRKKILESGILLLCRLVRYDHQVTPPVPVDLKFELGRRRRWRREFEPGVPQHFKLLQVFFADLAFPCARFHRLHRFNNGVDRVFDELPGEEDHLFAGLKLCYNPLHSVSHTSVKLRFFNMISVTDPEILQAGDPEQRDDDQGDDDIEQPLFHGSKICKSVGENGRLTFC
jgi:hypothetical protein